MANKRITSARTPQARLQGFSNQGVVAVVMSKKGTTVADTPQVASVLQGFGGLGIRAEIDMARTLLHRAAPCERPQGFWQQIAPASKG